MTPDATMVVRYGEAARTAAERTVRKLVRVQGVALLILAMLLALFVLGPFIAAAVATGDVQPAFVLTGVGLLLIPIALGVLGVRQLRRRPHLPEVAVTITPTAVIFPAIDRPSALALQIRAEEWPREGTSAELIPASGLNAARVEFTSQHGGKRHRRSIAAGNLDVDPRVIVDVVRGAHTA